MAWIISIIFALIVSGAVFFVGGVISRESAPGSPGRFRGLMVRVGAVVLLALWIIFHTAAVSIRQIEAGHVGVIYQFGEIVGQREEGLQFIAPWQSMRTASVQVQRRRFENINAFSKETQDVFITATLNYSVSPGEIQNLYRSVGTDWFERLVETRINNFFKEETVKFQTVEIAPNRETLRSAVRERLRADLLQYSISISDLLIDDIDFRPEFKAAIEQKQIATQDALREQERISQRQAEAQQAIEVAKGEAEAVKVRAEGDAAAITIAADAQAQANRVIGLSLTPAVIQFQAVQKLAGNVQIALIPSGQGIIIDPASLLAGAP